MVKVKHLKTPSADMSQYVRVRDCFSFLLWLKLM